MPKNSVKRKAKIVLIVGGRGTGKTTYLERICPKNSTVVELFITDRYNGNEYRRIAYDKLTLKDCVNTTLIIEDATQICAANSTRQVKQIIVSSKQLGSDVFIVFHSVNFIPVFVLAMFDYLVLFDSEPAGKKPALQPYAEKINAVLRRKHKQFCPCGVVENL